MINNLERLADYNSEEVGFEGDLDPDIDLIEARIIDSFSVVAAPTEHVTIYRRRLCASAG